MICRVLLHMYFLFFALGLSANEMKLPELPNFISLLYSKFSDVSWVVFLHNWESLFFSILVSIFVTLFFWLASRKQDLIPSGIQNFIEWSVENFQGYGTEILSEDGKKYVPFLGTLFIFILSMNWMVVIPLMKSPTSNLNITAALAICVFVHIQFLNIRNQGIKGFLYHLAGSPKDFMGWLIVPLILPIELLTQFTRPLTLALRLFGNVTGEDVMIGAAAMFGSLLLSTISPIGLPLQIPFMFLALLTGLMQAMVFTLLTAIYILLSQSKADEHIT